MKAGVMPFVGGTRTLRRLEPAATRVSMRFLLPLLVVAVSAGLAQTVELSDAQALEIGRRIWKNECGATVNGLTAWNAGEVASLGIAHFIWYPEGKGSVRRGPQACRVWPGRVCEPGVDSPEHVHPGEVYGGFSRSADDGARRTA
jgi:hypothetical protein